MLRQPMFSICFRIIVVTTACLGYNLQAQTQTTWYSFIDEQTELIGFKEQNGNIAIEPKFMGYTVANKLDNIMAVTEEVEGNYNSYYITRQGRIIGRDSLYIFDNGADCESEGFIRFRDSTNDNAGMFNRQGEIIIPAEYNDLSRVRNGLVIALQGAEKEYWNHEKHNGCNHYSWKGGEEYLLDTNGNVLIEDFKYNGNLNLYSMRKAKKSKSAPFSQTFKGNDGDYYTFIDYKEEFTGWLKDELLSDISEMKLAGSCFDSITYWIDPVGWKSVANKAFIESNFNTLKKVLDALNNDKTDYFVAMEGLNPFIFQGPHFEKYFNNCGGALDWKYPVFTVVINSQNAEGSVQDQIDFLRIEGGYKLISASIRSQEGLK